MYTLIIGDMTFHHFTEEELKLFKTDKEQKAIVHVIQDIHFFETEEEGDLFLENNKWMCYLIPQEFDGEIVFDKQLYFDIKEV